MNMTSILFFLLTFILVNMALLVSSDEQSSSSTQVQGSLGKDKIHTEVSTEEMVTEDLTTAFTRQQTLRGCTNSTGDGVLLLRFRNEAYKYLVGMIVTILLV